MGKMRKKLLVVGGTGFIGFHILKKGKKLGYNLTSISLNKPKKERYLSGIKYLNLDISKKKELKKIKNNFDYVVNAGGYGGLDSNFKNPTKIFDEQYNGVKNIAGFFLNKKITKFIQIGSSLEYASSSGINNENMKINNPITTYGKAKLYSTNYLKFLFKIYNFPAVILRLYQVYGPTQKNNRIIPYVIESLKRKENINTTKGDQIRDFCFVDDVVEAIYKCFHSQKTDGEVINIGYGKGYKISDVLKKIFSFFPNYNIKKKVKRNKIAHKQTKKLVPSIKKAKKILNWKPKISLNKGIELTLTSLK
jgi:nucleoside-diphosphate-sugar epimerase